MVLRPLPLVAATLLAAFISGCGSHAFLPLASSRAPQAAQAFKAAFPAAPVDKAAFIAASGAKGIKFTDAQLIEIQGERQVKPSGLFAPRPAANLTAQQNLDVHWRKHGSEFKPAIKSPEDYVLQGNAAGDGTRGEVRYFFDTTSYKKGYQTHVVRWVPKTMDFTAFRTDGAQTTYYQNVPQAGRFVEVPTW